MPLSTADQLSYITVRISVTSRNGNGVGTGFFFSFSFDNGLTLPVVVTNRHIVSGADVGEFSMTRCDSEGTPIAGKTTTFQIPEFESLWIFHPDDNIDLCVLPLHAILYEPDKKGMYHIHKGFSEDTLPTGSNEFQLTAMEEILMIGYPIGIWDSANNFPVFRRGITATHPERDYEGNSEFLIDAACFPGSSGSPVILYSTSSYTTSGGGMSIGERLMLLGIQYAIPQYNARGNIVATPIPSRVVPLAETPIPINLGYVIRANRLLDFKPILAEKLSVR